MVTRVEGSSVLSTICGDGGPLHRVLLPLAPAGRPRPTTRNGFRFLQRYGQHGGCKWCGIVLSIPAHGAVALTLLNELLVAVLQVDEVGEFSGREIADFRGASGAEMERQMAKKWGYGTLRGTVHPARTLGRGVARWLGEWRL